MICVHFSNTGGRLDITNFQETKKNPSVHRKSSDKHKPGWGGGKNQDSSVPVFDCGAVFREVNLSIEV